MNQYPVLFFSLKDVMHLTFEKACVRLQSVIADVCKNFSFLENSEKTNEFLKFAVITGCLRIAKESIFTGVNHFVSYSVLNEPFSDSFGFTENEVKQLLADAGLKEKLPEIKT